MSEVFKRTLRLIHMVKCDRPAFEFPRAIIITAVKEESIMGEYLYALFRFSLQQLFLHKGMQISFTLLIICRSFE